MSYHTYALNDKVASRFLDKLLDVMTDNTSNTSNTATNSLQDIFNIAFSSSPENAKLMEPYTKLFMDTFNTIVDSQKTNANKQSTKCTEANSQCNTKAENTADSDTVQNTDSPINSKIELLGNKSNVHAKKFIKLAEEIKTLPGGKNKLETILNTIDCTISFMIEQEYQKLLAFREEARVYHIVSIESIVKSINPKAILPETAKQSLLQYVNSNNYKSKDKFTDVKSTASVLPEEQETITSIVNDWLRTNTAMYVEV